MVLKFYTSKYSTNVQRVLYVLKAKDIPFERIEVELATGEQKSEAYLKTHPFGTVPYIDDDGFILYESRAICTYLATKYADSGPALIPTDPKAISAYQQGVNIEMSIFDPWANVMIHERVYTKFEGAESDEHIVKFCEKTLMQKLECYERVLSKQKYIGGDTLTLADINHLPSLNMLPVAGFTGLHTYPSVSRWVKEITALPTWQPIAAALAEALA